MSENNQFIEYKQQISKCNCTGGLDSCSGEGMLNTEAIRNAPGLTPLKFVNDIFVNEIQDENIKSDFAEKGIPAREGNNDQKSFSEICVPLTGETLKKSSALTSLHPFGEIHDMNLDREDGGFPATESKWRTSSGLTPLRPGSKINKIRVIE